MGEGLEMAAARTWKELEMAEVWSKKSPLNQEELVSLLKILPELLNKLFDRYTQFKRSSDHVDFTALRRTALLLKLKKGQWRPSNSRDTLGNISRCSLLLQPNTRSRDNSCSHFERRWFEILEEKSGFS